MSAFDCFDQRHRAGRQVDDHSAVDGRSIICVGTCAAVEGVTVANFDCYEDIMAIQSRKDILSIRRSGDVGVVTVAADHRIIPVVGFPDDAIVVGTAVAMLALSWRLALISLVVLPPAVLLTRQVARMRHRVTGERQRRLADLHVQIEEGLSVSGVLLTKTLGASPRLTARFEQTSADLVGLEIRSRLADLMADALSRVWDLSESEGLPFRRAALVTSIREVAEALEARGIHP